MNVRSASTFVKRRLASLCVALGAVLIGSFVAADMLAAEKEPYAGSACAAPVEAWFVDEVWTKIGATECVKCHKTGGDAEETRFVLRDLALVSGDERDRQLRHNRDAFARVARLKDADRSLLLAKVVGDLDHGGKQVLKPDSTGYRILAEFVRRSNLPTPSPGSVAPADPQAPPFFQGVVMLDERRLLRRATLSLAGRLPTPTELQQVADGGLPAVQAVLDELLKEDAFYERLREGFNDIFLTLGIDGNADASVLSYEHFENTRLWYQKHDLSHIADENERRRAGYKLADD